MTVSDELLYKTISTFNIDDEPVALPFFRRLARENKWAAQYSERCIAEYKKFIYLSQISEISLTPSDQVDQVWHLHLTYTKSYWTDLCQGGLKKEFHHGPTKGGKNEADKYWQQYRYTLDLYEKEFGLVAPEDIWPEPDERFKDADQFLRVNKSSYWLIKKPSQIIAPLLFFPLFIVACTGEGDGLGFWSFIMIAIGIYGVYKIIQWINQSGKGNGGGCGGGSGCGGSGCGGGCGG